MFFRETKHVSLKQSPSTVALEAARAATRLARQVAVALGNLDLSPSQYRLLLFLSEGNAAASAVAGRLAVSRPSVTALADGLEKRGLLQRKSDPADRRKVAHELTQAGTGGAGRSRHRSGREDLWYRRPPRRAPDP